MRLFTLKNNEHCKWAERYEYTKNVIKQKKFQTDLFETNAFYIIS